MAQLVEVQEEVALVKKALSNNDAYLGIAGENLQQYLLRLMEKENLLLSNQVEKAGEKLSSLEGAPKPPDLALPAQPPTSTTAPSGTGGYVRSPKAREVPVAKDMPAGPVDKLDGENLESIFTHMSKYEASAVESAKALRALSQFAYTKAKEVGDKREIVPQLLRLLTLHPTENLVQLNGIKALCNMAAYNRDDEELTALASKEVLAAIIASMSRKPASVDLNCKGSEAMVRILGKPSDTGLWQSLFPALAGCLDASRITIVGLLAGFIINEIATPEFLAKTFVESAKAFETQGANAAAWLSLCKTLATSESLNNTQCKSFLGHMLKAGTLEAAQGVMSAQIADAEVQIASLETIQTLVGDRVHALQSFADNKGMERIEAALSFHPHVAILQTKGIRTLTSGIKWGPVSQEKAGYSWKRSVEITKVAMANHTEVVELQMAAMESLAQYVSQLPAPQQDELRETLKEGNGMVIIQNSLEFLKTRKDAQVKEDVQATIQKLLADASKDGA